jgi:hypothetical protein
VLTDEIAVAAEVLARDPRTQKVAEWLARGCPGSVFAHLEMPAPGLAGQQHRAGERRHWLLKIAPPGRGAAPRLARWLAEYRRSQWGGRAGTRAATTCPHDPGSREEALWHFLKLSDRELTDRAILSITRK